MPGWHILHPPPLPLPARLTAPSPRHRDAAHTIESKTVTAIWSDTLNHIQCSRMHIFMPVDRTGGTSQEMNLGGHFCAGEHII